MCSEGCEVAKRERAWEARRGGVQGRPTGASEGEVSRC